MIWRCPTIRFFDYKKVKDVEREKAKELFGTSAEPSALASKVCAAMQDTPIVANVLADYGREI